MLATGPELQPSGATATAPAAAAEPARPAADASSGASARPAGFLMLRELLVGDGDDYRRAGFDPAVRVYSLAMLAGTGMALLISRVDWLAALAGGAMVACVVAALLVLPIYGMARLFGAEDGLLPLFCVAAAASPFFWPLVIPYHLWLPRGVAGLLVWTLAIPAATLVLFVLYRALVHLLDLRPIGAFLAIFLPLTTFAALLEGWYLLVTPRTDTALAAAALGLAAKVSVVACLATFAVLGVVWAVIPGWTLQRRAAGSARVRSALRRSRGIGPPRPTREVSPRPEGANGHDED